MAKMFTVKFIESIRSDGKRQEIPDSKCAGLYLLLGSSGHRSWCCRYRLDGKQVKLGLGAYPAVSLHNARLAATKAREQVAKGGDPAKEEADAKVKAAVAKADTVANVCESYLAYERGRKEKLRTLGQRVSVLTRLIYPTLGAYPVGEVKRSDIVRLLDDIEAGAGPRMADVTLAVLRRIFHWYEVRKDDFRSPIIRGMGRTNTKERARRRILNDAELAAVWAAAGAAGPFGALVKFLLLTSARRNEAAGLRWAEVDAAGIWMLPPVRSKTKAEVVRPLSKAARVLLAEQPRVVDCDFAFSPTGRSAIASFSGPKEKLDAASGVTGWRLHDLRRTARTLLSRAGVSTDIAERALGHAVGGVRGIYDRHQYTKEMTHAFEALAELIERIVDPPQGNVVSLARR